MANNKLTHNEIKKALECCKIEFENCEKCPYGGVDCLTEKGESLIMQDALDLINRQKAEIERLGKELIKQQLKNNMFYETAKEMTESVNYGSSKKEGEKCLF